MIETYVITTLYDQSKIETLAVKILINTVFFKNKLGLSWAKLSQSWGLKLEFEVEVCS